jgi:hypothetical protein
MMNSTAFFSLPHIPFAAVTGPFDEPGLYLTYVLAGPYELFRFRNTRGQLARRGRDLHFARYHVERAEERREFVAAVKYLLERVPLTCDLDALLKRWRWFADGSVGCIGIVKTWLVDAVAATLAQGGTSLTIDQLTRTMLHPAKRVSLEMEARAGEHQVETHNSESAEQLQVLRSHAGKAGNRKLPLKSGSMPGQEHGAQTEPVLENAAPSLPLPQVSPKPTKTRVGERAPSRDPVGETRQEEQSAKCSFGGVIDLASDAFIQAGVSKVECPDCGAMRTVRVQRNTVTFPSHPKRRTGTPGPGRRWIRRATAWELSERNV